MTNRHDAPGMLEAQLAAWCGEAGDLVLSRFRRTGDLEFKSGDEAVTEADGEAESLLRDRITAAYPDDLVVGEEQGGPAAADIPPAARVWHLDPIDGTLNFALGLPGFCTSVAVMEGDEVLAACVHQPAVGDTFTALRGGGARLNGAPLRVSRRAPLRRAVLSVQFKKDGRLVSRPDLTQALFLETLKIRKTGAIALEMAWTAAGFLDGMVAGFNHPIQLYDVAAGLLLVQEAGGRITDFAGDAYRPGGEALLATNGAIHDELLALVNRPPAAGPSA